MRLRPLNKSDSAERLLGKRTNYRLAPVRKSAMAQDVTVH